jgi:hypothetical protein
MKYLLNIQYRSIFICGGVNLFSSSDYGQVWSPEVSLGTGNINGIAFPGIMIITLR